MAYSDGQERELIVRAQGGNAQAMATLLQANYAVVFRTMVKLTLDAHAAEDATQDAMERAVRLIRTFDPAKARFSTWLVTIARNRWIDGVRKNRRLVRPVELREDVGEERKNPFDGVVEADALLRALKRLDGKTRTPVTMCYLLGYSYREIADAMKIPLGTVKSRISNGIKLLRKEIEWHE